MEQLYLDNSMNFAEKAMCRQNFYLLDRLYCVCLVRRSTMLCNVLWPLSILYYGKLEYLFLSLPANIRLGESDRQ